VSDEVPLVRDPAQGAVELGPDLGLLLFIHVKETEVELERELVAEKAGAVLEPTLPLPGAVEVEFARG